MDSCQWYKNHHIKMNIGRSYNALSYRVAEEAQLLAEEKWLIDALSKVKKQRNCLQIEKLYLESLKTKLRQSTNQNKATPAEDQPSTSCEPEQPVLWQTLTQNAAPTEPNMDLLLNEMSCNSQALDLTVSKSVFGQMPDNEFDMVEEEQDDEDIMLDINLLMQVSQ